MVRSCYLPLLLLVHVASVQGAGAAVPPDQVVNRFYSTLARPTSGFADDLEPLMPYLSMRLRTLLASARTASDDYLKLHPSDVPPFEQGSCVFLGIGDCEFSAFRLLRTSGSAAEPHVEVDFRLDDRNRPGRAPFRWRNTVSLALENGRWVILDIRTPSGTSSDALTAIIKESHLADKAAGEFRPN